MIGLKDSEMGAIGVISILSTVGCTIEPPHDIE